MTFRSQFKIDICIATGILAIPFLFYSYQFFPNEEVLNTLIFTVQFDSFGTANYFAWIVGTKLITLLLLSLWFITCKHWWRNFILIPIVLELYKIFGIITDEFLVFIHELISFSFLITSISVYLIILRYLTKRLKYFNREKRYSHLINIDFYNYIFKVINFRKSQCEELIEEFKEIQKSRIKANEKEFMERIMKLRENITKVNL